MKAITKLALATMLAGGAAGLALTPAVAKKEEAKPAKANYSPAFIKAAQPAQTAIKGDPLQAEAAVAAAEAAATTDDDKYTAGVWRVQIVQARLKTPGADQQQLRAPLEALVANPKTPPEQKGQFDFILGQLAAQRKDNAASVRYLTAAQQAGYADPQLPTLLAQMKLLSGAASGGTADLEAVGKQQEAAGGKASEADYRLIVDQYQKQRNKPQQIAWLRRWIAAYPTAANYHDALTIYALQPGSAATLDKGQLLDLFRLLRQTKSLDRYSYPEFGQKLVDSGLSDEAKSVLNEGIASGKMSSGPEVNALLAQANRQTESASQLAALGAKAQGSPTGGLAAQTADAYLSQKDYAKASELYRTALQKGGVDAAAVNTHLGIALAMSGDKEGARAAFNAVTTGNRADIAQFWVTYLDHPAVA